MTTDRPLPDEQRLRVVYEAELEARHAYERAKADLYLTYLDASMSHLGADKRSALETLDLKHAWQRARNERTIVGGLLRGRAVIRSS
jgi:hypothetical protein